MNVHTSMLFWSSVILENRPRTMGCSRVIISMLYIYVIYTCYIYITMQIYVEICHGWVARSKVRQSLAWMKVRGSGGGGGGTAAAAAGEREKYAGGHTDTQNAQPCPMLYCHTQEGMWIIFTRECTQVHLQQIACISWLLRLDRVREQRAQHTRRRTHK